MFILSHLAREPNITRETCDAIWPTADIIGRQRYPAHFAYRGDVCNSCAEHREGLVPTSVVHSDITRHTDDNQSVDLRGQDGCNAERAGNDTPMV